MAVAAKKNRAKKEPRGQKIDGKKPVINVIVKFGQASFGDHTASVGFKITRDRLEETKALEIFVNKRLTGRLIICKDGEDADQTNFLKPKYSVAGVFDVSRISVGSKDYSGRASFAIDDIDRDDFSHLANLEGRLIAELVQAIPDEEPETDDPKQKRFIEGPILEQDLAVLEGVDMATLGRLKEHGIKTIGQLKTIVDAGQLGAVMKTKAAMIENALFSLLEENPISDEEENKQEGKPKAK
jgi:hypothetical protein